MSPWREDATEGSAGADRLQGGMVEMSPWREDATEGSAGADRFRWPHWR